MNAIQKKPSDKLNTFSRYRESHCIESLCARITMNGKAIVRNRKKINFEILSLIRSYYRSFKTKYTTPHIKADIPRASTNSQNRSAITLLYSIVPNLLNNPYYQIKSGV